MKYKNKREVIWKSHEKAGSRRIKTYKAAAKKILEKVKAVNLPIFDTNLADWGMKRLTGQIRTADAVKKLTNHCPRYSPYVGKDRDTDAVTKYKEERFEERMDERADKVAKQLEVWQLDDSEQEADHLNYQLQSDLKNKIYHNWPFKLSKNKYLEILVTINHQSTIKGNVTYIKSNKRRSGHYTTYHLSVPVETYWWVPTLLTADKHIILNVERTVHNHLFYMDYLEQGPYFSVKIARGVFEKSKEGFKLIRKLPCTHTN